MATFEYVKIGDGVTPWASLPYVAGYPGATGAQGVQGAQGNSGSTGGLTLQLDYGSTTTFSGTVLTGSLLTTYNTGTVTSITVPQNITNTLIATFSIAANTLPGKIAVTDLWDLNLYSSVTTPGTPGRYW